MNQNTSVRRSLISQEGLERFPCSVRPVVVSVDGGFRYLCHRTLAGKVRGSHGGQYHGGASFGDGRPGRAVLPPSAPVPSVCCGRCGLLWRPPPLPPFIRPAPPLCGPGNRPPDWTAVGQAAAGGTSAGGNLVANVCMEKRCTGVKALCAVIAYAR